MASAQVRKRLLLKVVLTRPADDNELLASALSEAGVQTLQRPLLEIQPTTPGPQQRTLAADLDRFDAVVFVSGNAVRFGMPLLESFWPQWPIRLRWLAVGRQTAAALLGFDIHADFPRASGSDGLFRMIDWQGIRRVLIVRGKGGLERLRDSLDDIGVGVDYLEVYERRPRTWPGLAGEVSGCCLIVVTSGEGVAPLVESIDVADRTRFVLLVPSERVRQIADGQGFGDVLVTKDVDATSVLREIHRLGLEENGRGI